MTPRTADLTQRDTIRLITTGRLKEAVLKPLAANDRDRDDLAELESATSGRLLALQRGLPDLRPGELVLGRAGHTLINAAFAYTRPGGNRFNGEGRGAWYCAFDHETAVAEVGYHLTRALADVGRFDNATDYSELLADFIGPFHDLRGLDPALPMLSPDPAIGYPAGQELAKTLREGGSNGIIYPSVRRPAGVCLVAFHPALVQNLRQGDVWRLEWRGTPEPVVTRHSRVVVP